MSTYRLQPGYAEQSSSPSLPRCNASTVIVGDAEIDRARFYCTRTDQGHNWAVFKIPGRKRFYFQLEHYCRVPQSEGSNR
jgi:hypothetical protein